MNKSKHTEDNFRNDSELGQELNGVETTEQNEIADESTNDELEQLRQQNADLNDKNLRLMAEFDNYRKRTLKERADLLKTAGEDVLTDMLPLIDDFERAIKAMETTNDVAAVKEGVELIYQKFVSFMEKNGVKAIPTENEDFDTDIHEAVTTFPVSDEDQKGKIIDCVSKGYKLHDKVIRFPKVVVGE